MNAMVLQAIIDLLLNFEPDPVVDKLAKHFM